MAGSFSAAQFVTSYFWGVLSDRCGRKVNCSAIPFSPWISCHDYPPLHRCRDWSQGLHAAASPLLVKHTPSSTCTADGSLLVQPVILVSNVVTALAGISFGLAGSLELALTARIIGGLFNGSGV